jgi:predicted enzyme related to lactoylglutathione lyase
MDVSLAAVRRRRDMAQTLADIANRPSWVDLSSSDAEASRRFYSELFGWQVDVNEDPQYGGYALARIAGKDAAGIGPKMDPNAPTAWNLYIGTDDIDALATRVSEAGGRVLMAPFDVGDQGRMAVFADPTGAVISAWQGTRMGGFETDAPNSFNWAELNARDVDRALPFYERVFGWAIKQSPTGEGARPYTEFQKDGRSIAGAWEMNAMLSADVPSYWQIYFGVPDVDAAYRRALDLGAADVAGPQDFPGGRFAIVSDPQGASFGLLQMRER